MRTPLNNFHEAHLISSPRNAGECPALPFPQGLGTDDLPSLSLAFQQQDCYQRGTAVPCRAHMLWMWPQTQARADLPRWDKILTPNKCLSFLCICPINPTKSLCRSPAFCLHSPDQGLHIPVVSPPGLPVPSPLLLKTCLCFCVAIVWLNILAPCELLSYCDWFKVPESAVSPTTHMYQRLRTLWMHTQWLPPPSPFIGF